MLKDGLSGKLAHEHEAMSNQLFTPAEGRMVPGRVHSIFRASRLTVALATALAVLVHLPDLRAAQPVTLIKDINPATGQGSMAWNKPVCLTGVFYFFADDGNGTALWKTDTSTAGTTLVKRVSGANLTIYKNSVYFSVDGDPAELWKSDGTPESTARVLDLYASNPTDFIVDVTTGAFVAQALPAVSKPMGPYPADAGNYASFANDPAKDEMEEL